MFGEEKFHQVLALKIKLKFKLCEEKNELNVKDHQGLIEMMELGITKNKATHEEIIGNNIIRNSKPFYTKTCRLRTRSQRERNNSS